MRRTGKKEEVSKCSFEHTCRPPPWRVAGMTEMTRAVGLSCGADKRQRARASSWSCTGGTSPGSLLFPSMEWLSRRWVPARHIMAFYIFMAKVAQCPLWSGRGVCTVEGTLCTQRLLPSTTAKWRKPRLALLYGARMQLRGCAYIFLSYTNWHSKQSQHGRKR